MSTTAPLTPPARRYSKLLIASLALNLLIMGIAGGAVVTHRFGRHHEFHLGDPGLRGFMRSLPKERRDALRANGEQARQTWKPLRQAVQQARADVNAAMTASPFDAARVEKSLNDLIAAEANARRAGSAVLISAVSQMTPEERARFQKWRRKHDQRSGPPKFDDGPDSPPDPQVPPAPVAPK
ncbi:MAG: periplasmic heavy metal sensor [Hyphomicrobiaceae bacterium]